ncbi:hypothetical protein Tco_1278661, partial [Tanacetum coccineum]
NINTTQAEQKSLDDALVTLADRLKFGKCNMRLKTDIKPKEATFQVATVSVHQSSIRFTINKKKVSLVVDIFREILQFCPKILGQKFKDLPLDNDILYFIRNLGHSRDIIYLTNASVDYLHQPWRAFATIINKCLSGKETGMDKIRLYHAQILWGMFYKKNIDYVYLLWEDFLFQIENKEAKNTNKISYPRFTKIIIDYFIHEDTQVYGTIHPKDLTNQAMLESKAYKTYYAFAYREKTPKPKYKKQPAKMPKAKGLDVLSKVPDEQHLKTIGADEGTGTIPGVPDVPKYESESEKESWGDSGDEDEDDENDSEDKSDGNDDDGNQEGDDTNNNNEETDSDSTESDRIKILVLNQSSTEYYEEEEKIDDEETMDEEEDDEVTIELYDDVNVNLGNKDTDMTNADQGASEQQNVSQESGFEQVEEDAHVTLTSVLDSQKDDELVQSSSVSSNFTSKLLNLENPSPADNEIASLMETSARHVTGVLEITSSFTITIPPPPPFFNPLPQQATPTPTPTTSEATTSFPSLLDFSSIVRFNDRVTNLEKDLSEIKQVDQYAQALSSIPAIVDRYIDNKLREAINKAIQAHNLDCRQEAQDEKNAYIELVDTSMRAIIKEEKNVTESLEAVVLTRSSSQPKSTYEAAASLSEFELTKILLDKMEESKSHLRADYKNKLYDALAESYNNDKDLFNTYGEVFTLKRSRDDIDKDRDPSAGSDRGTKKKEIKQRKDPSHTVNDSGVQQDQEFDTGNNDEQPANKEVPKDDWFKKPERPPTPDSGRDLSRRYSTSVTKIKAATYEIKWIEDLVRNLWSPMKDVYSRKRISAVTRLLIMKKYDYGHLEEIEVRREDQKLYKFREGDLP